MQNQELSSRVQEWSREVRTRTKTSASGRSSQSILYELVQKEKQSLYTGYTIHGFDVEIRWKMGQYLASMLSPMAVLSVTRIHAYQIDVCDIEPTSIHTLQPEFFR